MSGSIAGSGSEPEDRDQRRVTEQIDTWRKQLINLARSNRLLYFRIRGCRHLRSHAIQTSLSRWRIAFSGEGRGASTSPLNLR